ncbi:cytochrome c oxidase, cbb3-type, subunit III [Rhodobacterales bacterium HTCC2150]|nr:cytochrome c oxidase, cbb3-type, subunit III [Rhodobacterales bacterium HTCC2150] [Rhodobacteraceae bacterium HTCC2150]
MSDFETETEIDDETGVETTGHDWDGIKELNNPLPRWWLWSFYISIVWGIGYVIAYPAWPMITGATQGMLGYSTRGEVASEIARFEDQNSALTSALSAVDLNTLGENAELNHFAVAGGAAVFRSHCSQCHGSGANGSKGYPNLLDDDWLWGGTIDQIAYSIKHGVRNEVDEDAHYSEMPAFGDMLEASEINQVVHHVRSITGLENDADLASLGQPLFMDNCSSCHGDNGKGDREIGAPNLTDAIWLYGGDVESLTQTISTSRFGVMPAWGMRLKVSEINAVAAYVHQLGGGE